MTRLREEEKEKSLSPEQDVHEVISTVPISHQGSQLPLLGHSCEQKETFFSLNIPTDRP